MSKKKYDYGWDDLLDFEEAVTWYCEMVSLGHNRFSISRMLKEYFPGISPITIGKIRTKAFKKFQELAKNIETDNYLAESIIRLKKLMSNPHEKTKNILAADAQLTHLLGLTEKVTIVDPDAIAAKIREAIKEAKNKTVGVPEDVKRETEPNEASSTEPDSSTETSEQNTEIPEQDEEITKDEENALRIARFKRLKQELKDMESK